LRLVQIFKFRITRALALLRLLLRQPLAAPICSTTEQDLLGLLLLDLAQLLALRQQFRHFYQSAAAPLRLLAHWLLPILALRFRLPTVALVKPLLLRRLTLYRPLLQPVI
jgi:hypothetical protein